MRILYSLFVFIYSFSLFAQSSVESVLQSRIPQLESLAKHQGSLSFCYDNFLEENTGGLYSRDELVEVRRIGVMEYNSHCRDEEHPEQCFFYGYQRYMISHNVYHLSDSSLVLLKEGADIIEEVANSEEQAKQANAELANSYSSILFEVSYQDMGRDDEAPIIYKENETLEATLDNCESLNLHLFRNTSDININ